MLHGLKGIQGDRAELAEAFCLAPTYEWSVMWNCKIENDPYESITTMIRPARSMPVTAASALVWVACNKLSDKEVAPLSLFVSLRIQWTPRLRQVLSTHISYFSIDSFRNC